ncbi:SRPBCC family protein [Nocardioides sp. SYSU D00038]|uniref:SRPBCC family protein n=1 Tax=Nocardioides sp. SYSU D00038 TaxID=2812554 RepID=UPI001966E15D|nr:SRPBCC family protein [Nocardioides sp. SYSU D00038]
MSTNTRTMQATPEQLWEVLADGWLYPLWVVGASRMREVDDSWPAKGSQLHHSVGTWPMLIDDSTEVLESRPHSLLKLRARGWPAGEAQVTIRIQPHGDGCTVVLEEDVASGPGLLVPKPLRDVPLGWRNVETLRRLAFIAERRQ